uniref:(northern house mosquito) hypothetical protein n=1 Tax=Culex pipiens TaxID=7175 RepID=A0A8D8CGH4_CULPI
MFLASLFQFNGFPCNHTLCDKCVMFCWDVRFLKSSTMCYLSTVLCYVCCCHKIFDVSQDGAHVTIYQWKNIFVRKLQIICVLMFYVLDIVCLIAGSDVIIVCFNCFLEFDVHVIILSNIVLNRANYETLLV